MKKILLLALAFVLIGCAQMDKNGTTKFEPYKTSSGAQQFKYFAHSTLFSPSYSDTSEAYRLELLQMWLDDNKMCKGGYTILERKEVDTGLGDAVKDIYYTGQCK